MYSQRVDHTASVFTNGKVLVTGGEDSDGILNSAELYDPSTGTWISDDIMKSQRVSHTASILTNRKALVTGGWLNISMV
ncbi:unnamed protein product [Rotaria sp. Silwood2]|nr:unnamed protein product [Rotaria sp. Silwood2]